MICVIEGCESQVRYKARGWCNAHYQRWWKTGDPLKIRPAKWDGYVRPMCKAEGCPLLAHGRGYCISHLKRFDRHGDPLAGRRNNGPPDQVERFWYYTDKRGENDCWPWRGSRMTIGYGQISGYGYAHRFSFELANGPIDLGLVIDHKCHNADLSCPGKFCDHRLCVNPDHLEAVTSRENLRRGFARIGDKRGRIRDA